MRKVFSGSAVPRHLVFILQDGTFAVQWDERRVQELLSGRYRDYQPSDFGHAITDYELNQLKAAGRVEHHNKYYVWLFALPEQNRVNLLKLTESRVEHPRSYYLNTQLPPGELKTAQKALEKLRLDGDFSLYTREGAVVVRGKKGVPFRYLVDAEKAIKQLSAAAPQVFGQAVIAFVESALDDGDYKLQTEPAADSEVLNAADIVASLSSTTLTAGKLVVLALSQDYERDAFSALLAEMKMNLRLATSGAQALQLVEDEHPELLLMDMQLPDMHGWRMIQKVREIGGLHVPSIIVVADHTTSADEQTFALTVVGVDVFLIKPLSMAKLRYQIWLTLKNRSRDT